ncbi:hypothetical protein QQG55_46300 [Brugia pahangi]
MEETNLSANTSRVKQGRKLENRTIEWNKIHVDKQYDDNMEECVVNQRNYRNQQEYYAVVRRGQITPKRGSKHEEMPSFNFHAVVLEIAKKRKDKTTYMMNNDEIAEKEHEQISNENDHYARNFINYRRRVVDVSDAKTCALLMAKIKEATQSSQDNVAVVMSFPLIITIFISNTLN